MKLLQKTDSGRNTIFVFEDEGKKILKINALTETHSIYQKDNSLVEPLEGHYWNFINLFPYMAPMKRALIIGLGAGTMTRQLAEFHPDLLVDGVEIDPEILRIAEEHFSLRQKNLTVHQADGVQFVKKCTERYDLIALDAFDEGNLARAFVEQRFFSDVKNKLADGGYFIANYIHEDDLHREIKLLFLRNFKDVYMMQIADSINYLIIGTDSGKQIMEYPGENSSTTATINKLPARLRPLAEYMAKHLMHIGKKQ